MDLMTYLLATKQGGGGTEVVANPEGETPTDDLESLKVGEKTYAIPEGGSASNNFIIEASIDDGDLPWPEEGVTITIDKTSEEITTALNAGKNLFVKLNFDETSNYSEYEYWLIPFNRRTVKRVGANRGENKVSFACTLAGSSNTGYMEITINLDDDIAYVDTRNFTDDWS